MIQSNVTPTTSYYARLNLVKNGGKTPKYRVEESAGYYPSMDAIRGKDGFVSMYLVPNNSTKSNAPDMKLQGKDSLNFTGLHDYFIDGKLSGYAYGYPFNKPTYGGRKPKPNPFFENQNDGFLFLIHIDEAQPDGKVIPTSIELIVLEGAKALIKAYCKQLVMGGFDEALQNLRELAKCEMSI